MRLLSDTFQLPCPYAAVLHTVGLWNDCRNDDDNATSCNDRNNAENPGASDGYFPDARASTHSIPS